MKTNINYATWIMFIAFCYLFGVTFLPVTETGNEHAKTIIGFLLGTAFSTLINYYWGNSKKSPPEPDNPKMDEAVRDGTEKLQAAQIEAVKNEGGK